MNMNPNAAEVVLIWNVLDGKAGQEVVDIKTEPASDPKDWPVASYCRGHNISLVQGAYALRVRLGQPIEALLLPIALGDLGKEALLRSFEPKLARYARELAEAMSHCPNEQVTGELAEHLLRTALLEFNKPIACENGVPIFKDLVDLRPGFLNIESVSCTECMGGRKDQLVQMVMRQRVSNMGLSAEALAYLADDENDEDLGREFKMGDVSGFIKVDGTMTATVRVGFAKHDNTFPEALNTAFAEQLAQAVRAVEFRVVLEFVATNQLFIDGLTRLNTQLSSAFHNTPAM